MARKNNIIPFDKLRGPGENIFGIPNVLRGFQKPLPKTLEMTSLKPNTRYKVVIDNQPGNDFEDITDFCDPVGDSIEYNTHKASNRGRWTYFKSDPSGKLTLRVRNIGNDEANITDSNGIDWTDTWKYWNVRTQANDRARDKVKLIAYNKFLAPDTDVKIKTLKEDISSSTTLTSGGKRPSLPPELALDRGEVIGCIFPVPGIIRPPTGRYTCDMYQTFWVSAEKFDNSETIDITDISLYFRKKSEALNNKSGRARPGVNIFIAKCEKDGTPIVEEAITSSFTHISWASINPSPNASAETRATFTTPITVETNNYYAIGIAVEDKDTILWDNLKGDYLMIDSNKTELISQGSSKGHRGSVYRFNSSQAKRLAYPGKTGWTEVSDIDIKFDVHIAEYDVNSVDISLVNKPYEFLTISNTSAGWAAGELVFKDTTNLTGNVTIAAGATKIVGSGTDFTTLRHGQKVVVTHQTDLTDMQVFTIDRSIGSNTSQTVLYVNEKSRSPISGGSIKLTVVGELEYYDYYNRRVRLRESSVTQDEYALDDTMIFAVGDTITGIETGTQGYVNSVDELPVSVFKTDWKAEIQPQFKPLTSYNVSYENVPGDYYLGTTNNVFYLNYPNFVREYEGTILSASVEAQQTDTYIANNEYRSAQINITYQYLGDNGRSYKSPTLDLENLNMICHRWSINNSNTNEHLNFGSANTRHITKVLKMGQGNSAEDIRVILNAYRPEGTNIDVYAKIINEKDPEAFDDKQWTKLDYVSQENDSVFSSKESLYDYREYEYTFSNFTEAASTLQGTFVTQFQNTVISGVNFDSTEISNLNSGDTIKLYSPLFDSNYQLYTVDSANNTAGTITLNTPIANVNIEGTGFKVDTMIADQAAFKNPDNYGIIRYFNSAGTVFDTYNAVAIKLVFRAESRRYVPKVDDLRVIGVTA